MLGIYCFRGYNLGSGRLKSLKKEVIYMGCGQCEPTKKATYICTKCGKEEVREAKAGEVVKSCCGQPMKKKK